MFVPGFMFIDTVGVKHFGPGRDTFLGMSRHGFTH